MEKFKVINTHSDRQTTKVMSKMKKAGWTLASTKSNGKMQGDVLTFKKTHNVRTGVRVAAMVVAIVELVSCAILGVISLAYTIVGSQLINDISKSNREAGQVFLCVFGTLLILCVIGIVISAMMIRMSKKCESKAKFIVVGVIGIVTLMALVTGIFAVICSGKCKSKKEREAIRA